MYLSFVLLYISLAVINAVYYCEPTFAPRSRNSANTSRTSRSTDFNSHKMLCFSVCNLFWKYSVSACGMRLFKPQRIFRNGVNEISIYRYLCTPLRKCFLCYVRLPPGRVSYPGNFKENCRFGCGFRLFSPFRYCKSHKSML